MLLVGAFSTSGSANSDAAFETLRNLEGKWSIASEGKKLSIQMAYDVGSKGSIVTEQFGKELSVFFRDGQHLEMIHFCNRGSQPRLRLAEGSVAGELRFETFDITNLKNPSDSHVQTIIYKFIDRNDFDLEIIWQTGKSSESEKYRLSRSPALA